MDKSAIDPMLWGFFSDETLELGERVGRALVEGAKHCPLFFGRTLLPEATLTGEKGLCGYTYDQGLWFNEEAMEEALSDYPEEKEYLLHCLQEVRILKKKARPLRDASTPLLEKALAFSGSDWGGHANPDYGRIVNLGTKGIRALIRENQERYPEKAWFYRSCLSAMEALDILGNRFRELAEEEALRAAREEDKTFLLKVAKAFSKVPYEPAEDFTEAMCSFMLL